MTKTHRSHTTVQFVEFFVHANINSEPKSKSNRFLINLHSTWNALPEDLRAVMDQAKFRKQLKAHYFTLAFNVIWLSILIMVALWNRTDHYIFVLWFLSSFFFFFSRLISAAADWMSTVLRHMMWPYSANLECRSEMCCKRLAENTWRKNDAKNRHLCTIAQYSSGYVFTTEARIDNRKISC